jgi:hypothetical protein
MRVHYTILETPSTWACLKRSNNLISRGAIVQKHSLPFNIKDSLKLAANIIGLKMCRLLSAPITAIPRATASTVVAASAAEKDASSVGVVIVDHGSKKKASNDMLLEFVDVYK